MTFSQFAGTSIIPTLARIVLGVSFISLGWCRLTEWVEFPSDSVGKLESLDIEVKRETPGSSSGETGESISFDMNRPRIVTASFSQDPQQQPPPTEQEESETEQPPPTEAEGETDQDAQPQATEEDDAQAAPDDEADQGTGEAEQTADDGTVYKAQRMHQITLGLEKRGIKYPKLIAMGVALTEMVGGGLLLIGLFSRVWGFALACAMAAAFYFSSSNYLMGNPLELARADNLEYFNRLVRHLSFFVLALGVMLTGPGPLSLDRILFKRESPQTLDPDLD